MCAEPVASTDASTEASFLRDTLEAPYSRRQFLKFCSFMTATLALPPIYSKQVAKAVGAAMKGADKVHVIWLEFQDCAGDSESFLRSSHPTPAEFILDMISLDYHETLMSPSGAAAELSMQQAMQKAKGKYIVVVEGSIPQADGGVYCTVAGKTAEQTLRDVSANAAAVIAVGTCAAFGGLPAASPNPTGAVGVRDIVKDKPVLNLSGCSANAVNISATLVHFLTFGELPATDDLGRPLFAYGALLHSNCPRRAHFDAGRFVRAWGDAGHRQGWCLFQMGCKGPASYANCPQVGWNDNTSWPIGAGHPCLACTQPDFWDWSSPFYGAMGEDVLPQSTRPARRDTPVGVALGVGGAAVGAAAGVALMRRQRKQDAAGGAPPEKPSAEGE